MASKVILLGDSGVGKTSLIQVKVNGKMGDVLSTVQPQDIHYSQEIEGNNVEVSIWDTPGQYTFRNMVKNFLRDALGIIYTFDISNRESFDELEEWHQFVNNSIKPSFSILVANKADLESAVDNETITDWANTHGITKSIQTSAKTTEGVALLFDIVAENVFKYEDKSHRNNQVNLNSESNTKKKSKCCK